VRNLPDQITCPHCGYREDELFLKKACPACRSRHFLIFGLRRPHEVRQLKWMLFILALVSLAALLSGVFFLYRMQLLLP